MYKVSVIIPVYNTEKYLPKCLDSVINQTLSDIEIICVNDGSYDNSFNILKKCAKLDNRIKIIDKENEGASIARNCALEKSTGEYIYFLDSDDWINENYLKSMYEEIKKTDADIIYNTNIQMIQNDDKKLYIHPKFKDRYKKEQYLTTVDAINETSCHIWARLYKKSYLDKFNIKFIKIKACNDLVFHYISQIYTDKLYSFFGEEYNYISRINSLTGSTGKERNKDMYAINAYSIIYDYFLEHNLLNKKEIKMFNVHPFFMVENEEKYLTYYNFFKKIINCINDNKTLYNELELFFINTILNEKCYSDYKNKYGINPVVGFLKYQKIK